MFDSFTSWIQGVYSKMFPNTTITKVIQTQTGVMPISPAMLSAIQKWAALYRNQGSHLTDNVTAQDNTHYTKSMNLAQGIASEIARTATIEMGVEVSGSARAEYLEGQLEKLLEDIRQHIEYGNALGSLVIKPYFDGEGIAFDVSTIGSYYPLAFDSNRNLTDCVFVYWKKIGNYVYTRLEVHRKLPNQQYSVENIAYRSASNNDIGKQVPLSDVPDWAHLKPFQPFDGITKPLFGYFRVPQANYIDENSPIGVSCFSAAADTIPEADKIYSSLLWEFESGKRAVFVDKTAFELDANNKLVIPDKRLYRVLNLAPLEYGKGGFFHDYSPEFRNAAIEQGLNRVLRTIEFQCGLSYGVLSDPSDQALTATEIKSAKQRYYVTVTDTQKKIKNAFEGVLYAMDVVATLYNLAPTGVYDAVYSFDDSIVSDHDTQFNQDKEVVDMGFMGGVEFRMRNFGESEEVARQKIQDAMDEKRAAAPPPAPVIPADNAPVMNEAAAQ